LGIGQQLIRRERLAVPQSARDVFVLIAQGGWMDATLADGLKRMVGFRNMPCAITERSSCPSPSASSPRDRQLRMRTKRRDQGPFRARRRSFKF